MKVKRINLVIPGSLFKELDRTAMNKQMSLTGLTKVFFRIGLALIQAEEEGTEVILRKDGKDTSIRIFF